MPWSFRRRVIARSMARMRSSLYFSTPGLLCSLWRCTTSSALSASILFFTRAQTSPFTIRKRGSQSQKTGPEPRARRKSSWRTRRYSLLPSAWRKAPGYSATTASGTSSPGLKKVSGFSPSLMRIAMRPLVTTPKRGPPGAALPMTARVSLGASSRHSDCRATARAVVSSGLTPMLRAVRGMSSSTCWWRLSQSRCRFSCAGISPESARRLTSSACGSRQMRHAVLVVIVAMAVS
mmetsp:Transcript_47673/g.140857  ORF Transcript_47673/g.140857 Transcript_47673/m.140857 type:complete len:235 (+) Transcript_47673:194-898(+)